MYRWRCEFWNADYKLWLRNVTRIRQHNIDLHSLQVFLLMTHLILMVPKNIHITPTITQSLKNTFKAAAYIVVAWC